MGLHQHQWTWAETLGLPGQTVTWCRDCGHRREAQDKVDIDGKPFCPTGYAQRYHDIGECDCVVEKVVTPDGDVYLAECAVCGKPSNGTYALCADHGRYGGVELETILTFAPTDQWRDLLIDILTNAEYEKVAAEGRAAKALGLIWDETCGDRFQVPERR